MLFYIRNVLIIWFIQAISKKFGNPKKLLYGSLIFVILNIYVVDFINILKYSVLSKPRQIASIIKHYITFLNIHGTITWGINHYIHLPYSTLKWSTLKEVKINHISTFHWCTCKIKCWPKMLRYTQIILTCLLQR